MQSSYGHVESIVSTQEAIFASSGLDNTIVLLHIKLNPLSNACDITVKSSSQEICNLEIANIIGLLSSRF